ncbi:hypothetical protein D3C80_1168170 [compost metagenome]
MLACTQPPGPIGIASNVDKKTSGMHFSQCLLDLINSLFVRRRLPSTDFGKPCLPVQSTACCALCELFHSIVKLTIGVSPSAANEFDGLDTKKVPVSFFIREGEPPGNPFSW